MDIVFPAHIAGHEAVVAAVDEQNRNIAFVHGARGGCFLKVKAAEQPSAKANQRVDRKDRKMIL